MARFAVFVILFALVFAMVAPSDIGGTFARDGEAPARQQPIMVESESGDSDASTATSEPTMPLSDDGTIIARGDDGQFRLDVGVNGQQLPFLVDTGADQVAITIDDARRIGILVEPQNFEPVGVGAGGVVRGQRIQLDSLEVAGHSIEGLDAVVIDGLNHNLLGQSVLRRLGRLELSGDTMTLY